MNEGKQLFNRLKGLERDTILTLKMLVSGSSNMSKHIANCPAIKVDIYNYEELVHLNGELIFLDRNGYHYSILSDSTLLDLIEIIIKIEEGI